MYLRKCPWCTANNSWLIYPWMFPRNEFSHLSLHLSPFWQAKFLKQLPEEWKWKSHRGNTPDLIEHSNLATTSSYWYNWWCCVSAFQNAGSSRTNLDQLQQSIRHRDSKINVSGGYKAWERLEMGRIIPLMYWLGFTLRSYCSFGVFYATINHFPKFWQIFFHSVRYHWGTELAMVQVHQVSTHQTILWMILYCWLYE